MSMQENANGIGVGQVAPDFGALSLNDESVSFKSLINGRKALLLFYRGSWCTHCNKQLTSISQDYEKF
jgi:peroxiredoxin